MNRIVIALVIIFIAYNYNKIPSIEDHITRNKYNMLPQGILTNIHNNKYMDDAGTIWIKRLYIQSLLHEPTKNYVFESYDTNIISSYEAVAEKEKFDSGYQLFKPATFNYYSSFQYPVSHFFADVLPIGLYYLQEDSFYLQ